MSAVTVPAENQSLDRDQTIRLIREGLFRRTGIRFSVTDGGDIVCTGPFTIHRPICRCCPLTNGGAGHCGHTVCCWAATWKGD